MNGILNILKPPFMTSHDVVSYIKKMLNVKKAGHTGTLDPMAAGVLPVTLNKATRICEYLVNDKKSYRAEMSLGFRSDTLDKWGNVEPLPSAAISKDLLIDTLKKFEGEIYQTPPMYSAVKVGGRKLYELAREGIVVKIEPRKVYIHEIKLVDFKGSKVMFDVTCSKGTYIRSLCSDIGKCLGSDAVMTFLIRKSTGPFRIDDSITLYELKEAVEKGEVEKMLYPIEYGLCKYTRVYVDSKTARKVKNGVGFDIMEALKSEIREFDDIVLVFDESKNFIASARNDKNGFVKICKVFL